MSGNLYTIGQTLDLNRPVKEVNKSVQRWLKYLMISSEPEDYA